jgi:hypothetical protein
LALVPETAFAFVGAALKLEPSLASGVALALPLDNLGQKQHVVAVEAGVDVVVVVEAAADVVAFAAAGTPPHASGVMEESCQDQDQDKDQLLLRLDLGLPVAAFAEMRSTRSGQPRYCHDHC